MENLEISKKAQLKNLQIFRRNTYPQLIGQRIVDMKYDEAFVESIWISEDFCRQLIFTSEKICQSKTAVLRDRVTSF